MYKQRSSERHPLESLVYLVLLAVAGGILFTLVALIFAMLVFKIPPTEIMTQIIYGITDIRLLKTLQVFSTVGIFIVPALVFARIESSKPLTWLKINRSVSFPVLLISLLLIFCIGPFLQFTINLNAGMHLPHWLNGLERWMRLQEDQAALITKQFLEGKTPAVLIINMLMIAALPAIGEELLFRGCLQQLFIRWFRNPYMAIWVTAIVFSAIHVQFFGFLPRMLLGALLGYLFFWTKNIWVSIAVHFTNNAMSVILAYYYQLQGKPLDDLINETDPVTWYACLGSIVVSAMLLLVIYRITKNTYSQPDTDGEQLA
ncbi:CPBP family intramembrane metalloprotease (plasmid) [Pedobacter sp. BS3]|uniref:CPBP family intramembrane glutamic endopeptidase n=1 Tax=Pedobacter sp. BS3 TaxID=2567937 RepID=UPI0011EE0470|nr:CPBP family intramembrane glutamic endopeptidase [Pedobacter sp. BS3]TZF85715.1 CPBP family intramembrane metalloprotease [Pedobacter sp. BS3]